MTTEDTTPHIISEIWIDATPQQIWDVLMDYDRLPEWSNGFLGSDKPMKAGERSTAYFYNPVTHGKLAFEHEVIVYDEPHAFGWSGDVAGGHHDRHIYEIIAQDSGGSLFRQTDGLYGKPSGVMTRMAESGIKMSYDSFNKKLKARVESLT